MATRKKTPALKKTVRKTASAAPRAKAVPALGDLGKTLRQLKLPGVDIAAIIEAQGKDMEALAEANRQAYEGIKALAERRNEMLQEAFTKWRDAMKEASGTELVTKQASLARQGVRDAIANVRELAQMEAKSRKEAWKVVQDRFEENLASLKKLLQPK